MSNPDRRVPNSGQRRGSGDGFFVDITPPEFGDKRPGENASVHQPASVPVTPDPPNVPGQSTFVERRVTPASTRDSNGLFFRTPKIKPEEQTGKSESAADLETTDEVPSVPDRIPLSGEESNEADSSFPAEAPLADAGQVGSVTEHPSESVTQDIPNPAAPGSEHPTDQLEVIDPSVVRPSDDTDTHAAPTSQQTTPPEPTEQSHDDQTTGPPEPTETGSIPASADTSDENLSPAQVQLAELRAMLSKMSKPARQPSDEIAERTTHEHPIGDELQAKLASGEPDETAIEVLPKGGDSQQLPPPPPVRPSVPYFPTPEQKKAHARFLPPDTRPTANPAPLRLSTPADDRYGLHEQGVPPLPLQSESLVSPSEEGETATSAMDPEVTGQYESINAESGARPGSIARDGEPGQNIDDTGSNAGAENFQRDGFFTNDDPDLNAAPDLPQLDAEVDADSTRPAGNASFDYDDGRRRPRRPADERSDYQVVDARNGEYDYDHEYYAASRTSQNRNQPSPDGGTYRRSASVEDRPDDHSWAPVVQGRRSENANRSRAGDAVDRMRIGRVIFLFLIAGVIGGFWWANSTGLINLGELTGLGSNSETTENSTNLSDDNEDDSSNASLPQDVAEQERGINDEALGLVQPESSETLNVADPDEAVGSVSEVRLLIQAESVDGDPVPGVPVEVVTAQDSRVLARVETSITGIATYNSDNPGCYRIQVQTPAGWVLDDPTGGKFASVCGEDSHSSVFKAVFRPATTAAPEYCLVRAGGVPKETVIVSEGDAGYADSYTLYDRFGRKLAETQDPIPDEEPGQAVLEWPPTVDFASDEIAALSATTGGEESLPTPCDLVPA